MDGFLFLIPWKKLIDIIIIQYLVYQSHYYIQINLNNKLDKLKYNRINWNKTD